MSKYDGDACTWLNMRREKCSFNDFKTLILLFNQIRISMIQDKYKLNCIINELHLLVTMELSFTYCIVYETFMYQS